MQELNICTVHSSGICTSQPDVYQCLVEQIDTSSTSMTHVASASKLRSVEVIHTSMSRKHVRSCIMPGLPTYLVQEINVGTVEY